MSEQFHEDIPSEPIQSDGEGKNHLPSDLSPADRARFEDLTAEQQQAVLLRWKHEPTKAVDVFLALLDQWEAGLVRLDQGAMWAEKTHETSRENALAAAKEAQTHISVIESTVGGVYQPAIRAEIQAIESGHADSETSAFLTSIGVDVSQPGALQGPEVQEIVRTRAAAKVYLSEPAHTEMARHPELVAAAEGLSHLRGRLGLMSSVPVRQVGELLTDQPGTVKHRATEIVEAVTAGATAAKVSRVGNVLRLQDGDGTVSHEIELRDPPVLVKRVGVLEARHEASEPPNEALHHDREQQHLVARQISGNLSTLGGETAAVQAWQMAKADEIPTLLDTAAVSQSLTELAEISVGFSGSPDDIRARLAVTMNEVHDAKLRADQWIQAGGQHPYPEDLDA